MEQNLIYIWEWFGQHIDSLPRMIGMLVLLGVVACLMYAVIFMSDE